MADEASLASSEEQLLQVYCSPCPEAYRVHVHPAWVPRHVQLCLDQDWEGMVSLDFEQLERSMSRAGLSYHLHKTKTGGVELEARGEAAVVMGRWLASMFASGVR